MENIRQLSDLDAQITARLLMIWESAVRKTHTFLSENDIIQLKPEVSLALKTVPQLYGFFNDATILKGFIGVAEQKIEMLFVDDAARGQGIGKQLLHYAITHLGATLVDVNEQNEQGVGFYKHMGFHMVSRSEKDDQGRPFPLLHLSV